MLKVGQLASRTGLTVRTLHHYDSIGLLTPSARSESGYRLYQRDDIARLYQIQALRRLGMSLADIGAFLAQPDAPFSTIVARQIDALGQQIAQATELRARLMRLQCQLEQGDSPALADWLTTLELMTMYDTYFSKEELAQLPQLDDASPRAREWAQLVARMRALGDGGTPAADPQAQQLACHWMTMVERDTADNPDLARRLDLMLTQEPAAQQRSGITPELKRYVLDAFSEYKLTIYAKYLDADELRTMRANRGGQVPAWLALIADVRGQMDAGAAPASAAAQALARRWLELFRSYAGDNPATREKMRLAHEKEPVLLTGSFMSDDVLGFIRQSIATLPAA
ncbi:MerR family transcriptional regulator [Duganella sp. FT3S]|uniref:MerR family transcriptional regulator n=1 Tax=Rugamonas fusca TaxID=2758568 RepID=A0A7W2I6G8_9BURK|nr:MerR family transcriptional regulator [Rugamonas fusca]MBA5605466.1 MerR family transcriptional regulator [Rugamonas fusca]